MIPRQILEDFTTFNVRNSSELREALGEHVTPICEAESEAAEKACQPISGVNAEELADWVNKQKPFLSSVEGDVRDARRRVSAAKPKRAPSKTDEAAVEDLSGGSDCPSE